MSFLIYPTIKESPFLSVLGMGGGGTGTVIGGAGPDMSEDFNQSTYYVIIPYYSSAAGGSGNRIALFNPTTGKYAADFETSTSSGKIYRFADSIVVTAKDRGWYQHYTYNNNWAESSGSFHSNYRGDEVKISSNRLWTLGWQTSSDLTAYIRVYSVSSSGLTNVANYTNTSMGAYNGYYNSMIDNPVIGVQAYVTASTGILSSIGDLHVKAPDGNSSNAHERRSSLVINNLNNGSFTLNNHSSSGNNYSRPIAGTGWDGYCYTSGMDGARTWVTNSGTSSTWSGFNCTPPTNGFHGVGVLGSSGRFITIVTSGSNHYFAWVTSSGTSTQYSIPTTTGATVQQYPNGAATCDYDSTVNKIRVRIYNSSTGWSTMYAATEFPPLNMLNYNYRKIITY